MPHTTTTYDRECAAGHRYNSGDPVSRWTNRKGNPRYWCPQCLTQGHQPPKAWKRAPNSQGTTP